MAEKQDSNEQRGGDLAANLVAGLRDLANFIAANPELADGFRYTLDTAGITVHLQHDADDKGAEQGRYARAAARHGATVDKVIDDQWHNVTLAFAGGVKAKVLAYRGEVCERVVTGTEMVTKSVPDPDALAAVPQVEVTEERRCRDARPRSEEASSGQPDRWRTAPRLWPSWLRGHRARPGRTRRADPAAGWQAMTVDELIDAMFAAHRADIDSVPFAHDNQWVGDQTPEVPR